MGRIRQKRTMVYKDKSQKWNNKAIWIFQKSDLNDFLKSNMDFPKECFI